MSDDQQDGDANKPASAAKTPAPRKPRTPRKTNAKSQTPSAQTKASSVKSKTTAAQTKSTPAAKKEMPATRKAPAAKKTAPTREKTPPKQTKNTPPKKTTAAKPTRKTAARKSAETTVKNSAAAKSETRVKIQPRPPQKQMPAAQAPQAAASVSEPNMDASEIVFYVFGILLYSILGMISFIVLMALQLVRTVFVRNNNSISGICSQLEAYISQIWAYASDPEDVMPFPFSALPSASKRTNEK